MSTSQIQKIPKTSRHSPQHQHPLISTTMPASKPASKSTLDSSAVSSAPKGLKPNTHSSAKAKAKVQEPVIMDPPQLKHGATLCSPHNGNGNHSSTNSPAKKQQKHNDSTPTDADAPAWTCSGTVNIKQSTAAKPANNVNHPKKTSTLTMSLMNSRKMMMNLSS
jgi:hypothetical protein